MKTSFPLSDFRFSPGTILVYSGRGRLSRLIEWATCSRYSHGATVVAIAKADLVNYRGPRLWKFTPELASWRDGLKVVESTSLSERPCLLLGRRFAGVQVHDLGESILQYDGRVWAMTPRVPFSASESERLTQRALQLVGIPYDELGALLAATTLLKRILPYAQDRSRQECVELNGDLLLHAACGRQLSEIKPGQWTPAGMVRLLVRSGLYGTPQRIK